MWDLVRAGEPPARIQWKSFLSGVFFVKGEGGFGKERCWGGGIINFGVLFRYISRFAAEADSATGVRMATIGQKKGSPSPSLCGGAVQHPL